MYPDTVEVLAFQLSATECCTGVTPVPDRGTLAGEPDALLTTEMLPLTPPLTVGLNCTLRVRFWAGESVTGVLPPPSKKPAPVMVICEMVTFEFPVLVIVTVCAVEDVPVFMLPKLRLVGLMPRVSVAAIPVPARLTLLGDVGALLTIEMLPEAAPADVGTKNALIVVVFPALTFKGRENPLTENPVPDAVSWLMVKVAVPVLVMIKVWDKLLPTTTLPKLMEVVLNWIAGAGAGFTVSVAEELVAVPAVLLITTEKVDPLSEVVVTGVV